MQKQKNFYSEEKFEALVMNELEEIQGGGIEALFYGIKDIFMDLIGKDDPEKNKSDFTK